MNTKSFAALDRMYGSNIDTRRYNLSDMISESYRALYECDQDSNMRKLVESHLEDVRKNPRDMERLSHQLSLIREVSRMIESNQLKDDDLIDTEHYDTPAPRKERVIVEQEECNESNKNLGALGAKLGDIVVDTKTGKEGIVKKLGQSGNNDLIYVDFGKGLRKINPMDDAQVSGRYVLKSRMEESIDNTADEVNPKKERVIDNANCNESAEYCIQSPKGDYLSAGAKSWVTRDSKMIKKFSTQEEASEYLKKNTREPGAKVVQFNESSETRLDDEDEDLLDDTELTEEELEELSRHLKDIRKNKAPTKESCDEAVDPEVDEPKATVETPIDHSEPSHNDHRISREELIFIRDRIDSLIQAMKDEDIDTLRVPCGTDGVNSIPSLVTASGCIDLDNAYKYLPGNNDERVEYRESKKPVTESTSYKGLENFSKNSSSKAFYKTFKKMHESLKEGKALTRQESMNLYKAANSAMTQLSVELEHNPEFLETFKECTTILSADVSSLLESMKRGKAPSKKTMKSLSKFSEALLCEEDHPEYLADFSVVDTKKVGSYEIQICTFSDHDGYGVQVVDNEGNSFDTDREIEDLTSDKFFKTKAEARKVVNKLVPILSTKYSVNESEYEDLADNSEDFVGDDEGDVQSEEADEFDQEYADARVELHKDLEAEHSEDEDPAIQDKIEQDKEEVLGLDGITDEQVAELTGEEPTESEESPEDEEIPAEDTPVEDDDEITDDELEELKRHLTEMRKAKRNI